MEWVGATTAGHRPGDVHRVLDGVGHTQGAIDGDEHTDDEGDATASHTLWLAELLTDHRILTERRVENPRLSFRVALQHESENRREQKQQREQRQKAVEGDQGGEIHALVVVKLVDHGDRCTGPLMPLLEAVQSVRHTHDHHLWPRPASGSPIPPESDPARR